MLTKATTYWYPAANRELVVPKSAGPLVLDSADLVRLGKALMHISPILLGTPDVGYTQATGQAAGADPTTGVRHEAFRSMQATETYFLTDPSGEPQPLDQDDASGVPYVVYGHRMWLRGYVGSKDSDQWNGEVEVEWGDAVLRAAADVTRGCWTGLYVGPFDPLLQAMGHLFEIAHGKRLPDLGWSYHGGAIERLTLAPAPSSAAAAWDNVQQGRVRAVVTGAAPAWDVQLQYHDGATWVTVHSVTLDLEIDMLNAYLGSMAAGVVVGQTQVHPGAPPISPAWPAEETWFRSLTVSEFHPFVPDIAQWDMRELAAKLEPWVGPPAIVPYQFPLMAADLVHMPAGSGHEPAALRTFDADLGWCVQLTKDSKLRGYSRIDFCGVAQPTGGGVGIPFLWCDPAWTGSADIPFFAGMRGRFTGMGAWAGDRHVFGFGHVMSAPALWSNGLGVFWRNTGGAGEGELVGRMYDASIAGWVEVIAPFNAADWDGVPVEVCIAWTGDRGADAERDDREFRILVDGQVRDAAVVASNDSTPLDLAAVGADRDGLTWYDGWDGFLAAVVIHHDALNDEEARHAFTLPEEPFANPSFEEAAASGRPGEAEDWFWNSVQQVGGWAEFNAGFTAREAWRTATEQMAAGWAFPYEWRYVDEAARLAAVGFAASDVGRAAYQASDDTTWVLTSEAPITWQQATSGTNEDWMADLADAVVVAALFNAGVSGYQGLVEEFALWTFPGPYTGPPWRDVWDFVAPWEDTIGPGPTGWSGWYDYIFGGHAYPLRSEQFAEAWGNDPFSTAGGEAWHPLSAPDGVLRGRALAFPLTIVPDRSTLIVYRDLPVAYDLQVAAGAYATAAALAAELEARWVAAAGAGTGLEFRAWADGADAGVEFGWDGATVVAAMTLFGVLESTRYDDARAVLGFDRFGPNGTRNDVAYPVVLLPYAPAGAFPTDRLLLDAWTMVDVAVVPEPKSGNLVPVVYELQPAVFDAAVPDPTWVEQFTLDGWIAVGATWKPHYDPADLTAAVFDSGATMEQFVDTDWPDQLWT